MSYLKRHAVRPRVDERTLLNRPGYHGDAYVRVYVEDTSTRTPRRRSDRPPESRIVLRIADCTNEISLSFELASRGERENSLHKIETLLRALQRFRDGLAAESQLYARREREIRQRPRAAA